MFSQAEQKKSLKAPIVMAIVTIFSFVFFAILGPTTEVTFQITETDAFVTLPDLALPSNALGYSTAAIMVLITIASLWFGVTKKRVPQMFAVVYGLVAIVALLGWLAAGADVPVGFLLGNTLVLALPIILGGMGGIMSERVGVVNIAIEGQLLTGAFLAAVIGSITGSLWAGVIAAMIGAALLSTILASLSIKYLVDQIIIGVLLNVLVIGVTNFLYSQVITQNNAGLNFPGTFNRIEIPILSQLPIIGDAFFNQGAIVYLTFLIVPALWFVLFRTKLGLRARAVGEHPLAADTVGINVGRTRFWWVTIGGAVAGLGGAAITVGNVGAFGREMTGGLGFIALAVVILGRWQPLYVSISALLFGFAIIMRIWSNQINPVIPVDFITMVPYLVTLIAVAGFAGRVRGPAATGKPYEKN
ncbi:MAG: ABC transporter permease [Actinobacteria bacterium]|nr:ABC transporter permease [Actinomycetota bacterium]